MFMEENSAGFGGLLSERISTSLQAQKMRRMYRGGHVGLPLKSEQAQKEILF